MLPSPFPRVAASGSGSIHDAQFTPTFGSLFRFASCGVLTLVAFTSATHAQIEFPALSDITRDSPAVVRPGETMTYRFTATPGTSPIEWVRFHFISESGNSLRTISSSNASSGQASVAIDASWTNDTYRLIGITARDEWARLVSYNAEGEVRGSTMAGTNEFYYAGPASHTMDFGELGFTYLARTMRHPAPS